ncbi:MAG: hypothetical protein ACE5Z5_12565 [Candidatus Bathyarchaeia archaeon]
MMGKSQAVYFEDQILNGLRALRRQRGGSFSSLVNFVLYVGLRSIHEGGLERASREEVRILIK